MDYFVVSMSKDGNPWLWGRSGGCTLGLYTGMGNPSHWDHTQPRWSSVGEHTLGLTLSRQVLCHCILSEPCQNSVAACNMGAVVPQETHSKAYSARKCVFPCLFFPFLLRWWVPPCFSSSMQLSEYWKIAIIRPLFPGGIFCVWLQS